MFAFAIAMMVQVGTDVALPTDRTIWYATDMQRDVGARSWFSDDDYPPEARRAGMQGSSQVTTLVSETGIPVACWVATSSGYAVLDAKTCELVLRRGRFSVARDADGQPYRYTYTLRARWVL